MQGINEEQLESVARMIDNYFGIEVDIQYVRHILLTSEHSEWLQEEVRNNAYTDTIVRDVFADAIAEDLIDKPWPTGDVKNNKEFFKSLQGAALSKGFNTVWDEH